MKKLSLTFLTIFLFSSAKASINPSIHSLCKDVKDYQGCVKLNSAQKISYYKFPNPKINNFTNCKKSKFFEDKVTEENTGIKTLICYREESIRKPYSWTPIDSERVHLTMNLNKYMSKNNEQLGWLLIQAALNCKNKKIEHKIIADNNQPTTNWNGSFEPRLDYVGIDKTIPKEFEYLLRWCPVKSGYQVIDYKRGLEVSLMSAVKKKDVYVLPASLGSFGKPSGKPFQIHLNCKEKRYRSFQNGTYGNSINVASNDPIFWRTCGSKK